MDCIDLAFDSFLLSALRNHVEQVQNESKTVDTYLQLVHVVPLLPINLFIGFIDPDLFCHWSHVINQLSRH